MKPDGPAAGAAGVLSVNMQIKREKRRGGRFSLWKGNNEEGEEKGRYTPSHGGEMAKASKENPRFILCGFIISANCGRNMFINRN